MYKLEITLIMIKNEIATTTYYHGTIQYTNGMKNDSKEILGIWYPLPFIRFFS